MYSNAEECQSVVETQMMDSDSGVEEIGGAIDSSEDSQHISHANAALGCDGTVDPRSSQCYETDQGRLTSEQRSDPVFRPILMDIQLLETFGGYVIKEMAYKLTPCQIPRDAGQIWPPPDRSLHYKCYRHDPECVPLHRTIEINGSLHDKYTGLEITCGEEEYSDERVLYELRCYNLIFLKGHNKKRVLYELFLRCGRAGHEVPKIVNVDAATMEEDDRAFCQRHLVGGAKFSFRFVYRRLATYLKLVNDCHNGSSPKDLPIYLNNIITADKRYDVFARGHPLWVCPQDHSCGQCWFSSQRCAAVNLGLLETLWYMMRDNEYRNMLKTDSGTVASSYGGFHSARCRCCYCRISSTVYHDRVDSNGYRISNSVLRSRSGRRRRNDRHVLV